MTARIYLDANVLETRFPELTGELQILAGLAAITGTELCIPHSVLIEHEHSTIRRVAEGLQRVEKTLREINIRIRNLHRPIPKPEFDIERFRAAYAAAVKTTQEYFRIQIVPIPQLQVEELVRSAARHAPPFKDEDRGFRDAVHLSSAIDHLRALPPPHGGDSYFMTADSRILGPETRAFIAEHHSRLKTLASIRAGIELVKAQLPSQTEQFLSRLGEVWTPAFVRHATEHLIDKLGRAFDGLELRGIRLGPARPMTLHPDRRSVSIGPATGDDRTFPVSYGMTGRFNAIGWRRDESHPNGGMSWSANVTFPVVVDAIAHADRDLELRQVTYRSVVVSAVDWKEFGQAAAHVDLSEPIEVIGFSDY